MNSRVVSNRHDFRKFSFINADTIQTNCYITIVNSHYKWMPFLVHGLLLFIQQKSVENIAFLLFVLVVLFSNN